MEEDTLYSDISLVNGKKFRFSTFENAPIFGRSSKDGYVTLGFTDESDVPQVIKKRHRTNAYLAREVRILECVCRL